MPQWALMVFGCNIKPEYEALYGEFCKLAKIDIVSQFLQTLLMPWKIKQAITYTSFINYMLAEIEPVFINKILIFFL